MNLTSFGMPGALSTDRGECFKKARYPVSIEDTDAYGAILSIRNGFTCSAHYEVIKNFMRMICEERTEQASKYVDRVKSLMKGII